MARLVADAQSGKAPVQRLADRLAAVFVPAVLLLAAATFLGWLAAGAGGAGALEPAVAVLIVACPCALGLATPMALLAGTGRGAQLGILIRGPEVLESTRRIDTVVIDKTGTLTTGRMSLLGVVAAPGADGDDVRTVLASLEAASEHPIGRAIAAAAPPDEHRPVTGFRATTGLGVEGDLDGRAVRAGRVSFLTDAGMTIDGALEEQRHAAEADGCTVVALGWHGQVRGLAMVADTIRPSSPGAMAAFERLGLATVLLTGDNATTAAAVGRTVGAGRVVAEVLPSGKLDTVRRLQAEGHVVAVVGDGVNDAAALAGADLGLAMGGGADASIEAADITLVRDDLVAAADAIVLSRRTLRTIKANLGWAFGYNIAALPVAAAGLLDPMLAGFAMAASSVLVVANSLRLFRFRPPSARGARAS
jgi:Cu+-exporting ATPase